MRYYYQAKNDTILYHFSFLKKTSDAFPVEGSKIRLLLETHHLPLFFERKAKVPSNKGDLGISLLWTPASFIQNPKNQIFVELLKKLNSYNNFTEIREVLSYFRDIRDPHRTDEKGWILVDAMKITLPVYLKGEIVCN